MPEPAVQDDQGSQVDQIANTPQKPADQPTIAKQSDKAPSFSSEVMDFLDIPPELQARLAPKAAAETETETPPESPPAELPESEPEIEKPVEDEEDEEEEIEPAAAAQEQQPKVDKRQKRINRLTRQKNDLERQIDHIIAQNQELRKALEQGQAKASTTNQPPGLKGGKLEQIAAKIRECDSMLEWCDENPDGGLLGRGEQAVEVDATTARFYRRKAEADRQEYIVEKREQEWELNQKREQSNAEAFKLWPEMFDKRTPEFQEAVHIIQQYPFLHELPDANLIVGTFLEGRKKLRDKLNAGKILNGEPQKKHRDVDERVFTTPRVPISPHTSEPLSREAAPSLTKRYNEAMSKLISDPDGGAGNVAAVFAAQEAARKTQPASRSQVRT